MRSEAMLVLVFIFSKNMLLEEVYGCWVQSIWRRLGACMRLLGACMRKRLGTCMRLLGASFITAESLPDSR